MRLSESELGLLCVVALLYERSSLGKMLLEFDSLSLFSSTLRHRYAVFIPCSTRLAIVGSDQLKVCPVEELPLAAGVLLSNTPAASSTSLHALSAST